MTSLKKLLAVAAASLPLIGSAQTPPADAAAAKPPPPLYQLYGTLNVNFQNTAAKNAFDRTANIISRRAISVDSTNFGIKGAADIDFGLQVIYQCESSANVDGVSTSALCNRNSRIGVSHPVYGTLFYGNWDTPYKALAYGTKADDPFGNTDVFGFNDLLSSPGFNTVSSIWTGTIAAPTAAAPRPGVLSFDLRANNSLAYWSPKIAGASLRVQYTADEGRSLTRPQIGTPISGQYGYAMDPYVLSVALNYDFGPFSIGGAYERHYDGAGLVAINGSNAVGNGSGAFNAVSTNGPGAPALNATRIQANSNDPTLAAFYTPVSATNASHASPTTQDNAWRIAAGYEAALPMGALTVSAMIENLTYTQDKPLQDSLKEYSRMAYLLGAKFRTGNHEFRARYTMADKGKAKIGGPDSETPAAIAASALRSAQVTTEGYGATSTALGYSYYLSKAAQVYVYYVRIDNEFRATYTFATQGPAGFAAAVPAGSNPVSYGLGIRYAF